MLKRNILRKTFVLLLVCALYICFLPISSFAICQGIGDAAPDFELEDLTSGETVKLSDYKGKIVILTFWATWCPRCWEEIDYIKARFEKDDDIVVLLVNMETQNLSPAHVKRIKKKSEEHAIKFPMLLDKGLKVWENYCVNSLPSTVIVDPSGNVAFAEPNLYFESRDKIEEVIKKYSK